MHIILTGSTGLIGTGILACTLTHPSITKITVLSRRPVPFASAHTNDPRINVILHTDFSSYSDPSLQEQLRDARGCVWALGGTSTSTMSKEEYVRSTKDYTIAAARAFAELGSETDPFRFVYVSGEGATQNPGLMTTLYAQVKGETEKGLAEVAEKRKGFMVFTPRPGLVDAAPHKEIQEFVPQPVLLHRVFRGLFTMPIKVAYKSLYVSTETFGNVCARLAMGKLDQAVEGDRAIRLGTRSWAISNKEVLRLAGSS
ncbi:nucleoside-diphosphate-sugar epimerase [Sarocladium implicatum]|nr:nucleoside-diphosphate-sugar epimerase [Sarocladium implicatum]